MARGVRDVESFPLFNHVVVMFFSLRAAMKVERVTTFHKQSILARQFDLCTLYLVEVECPILMIFFFHPHTPFHLFALLLVLLFFAGVLRQPLSQTTLKFYDHFLEICTWGERC